MASPQLKDGYTQIANEIMNALCSFRIPGSTRQVIDCIIRKTYGFHKNEDWISQSQIVEMTGMLKGNVSRELSKAITHKIVIESDNNLKFNKNYNEWIPFGNGHFNPTKKLSKAITESEKNPPASKVIVSDKGVIASDNKVIVSEGNKIYSTKETLQKINMASPQKNTQISDLLAKKKVQLLQTTEESKKTGITFEWQDKAFRYAKALNIELGRHAMGRWMKCFKQAAEGRNTANLEKAYAFLIDYPKAISNEQKMMFFFKIFERGTAWMNSQS